MPSLDSLPLLEAAVGYGSVGLNGDLGYEQKKVVVRGQHRPDALSAHPPSRLRFDLAGRFRSFRCQVALNDDVPPGRSHADFTILADGNPIAAAHRIRPGEPPRTLVADVSHRRTLELVTQTSRWEYAHAVWLAPELGDTVEPPPAPVRLTDCLARAEIQMPESPIRAERCIATLVSPGFERWLDDLLGSLLANGDCRDALRVVFALNPDDACRAVAAKYGATLIPCTPTARINPMSKATLYSVARIIDADHYVCLDADMLVLRSLRGLFGSLETCADGSVFACREGNSQQPSSLAAAFRESYAGHDAEWSQLGITADEGRYPLIVNDGLFAGGQAALMALDETIRAMPRAAAWADANRRCWWRNQFIFNLALARLRCGVELDGRFNVQLHVQDVQAHPRGAFLDVPWRGRPASILHFSGAAKTKYPEIRGRYAAVAEPVAGTGDGDAYAAFLSAFNAWVGRQGLPALAWSFYGLTHGQSARVRDPSMLPLLAVLHYLVRANGCVRVLETGTARGVSAACLASAVAHRPGGRVVTLDPYTHPGREELWDTLPRSFRDCIEARLVDSNSGLDQALERGESYDAALLDSVHTGEHVWDEFQRVSRIVCPGGLILIHDALYALGTVEDALRRIAEAGYGVTRLWSAEDGIPEDDHLGLAVIENRQHP